MGIKGLNMEIDIKKLCRGIVEFLTEFNVKVEVQTEWYTIEDCKKHPNKLYVFGDNAWRIGNGGQAVIRGLPNAVGVITKHRPGTEDRDYFSDSILELSLIIEDIKRVAHKAGFSYSDCTIVLPADGLGTGLSDMQNRSPELLKVMNEIIFEVFGVRYDTDKINKEKYVKNDSKR